MSVQFLLEIDLSGADIELFDRYEDVALRLFAEHGGVVLARVRDVGELREWHLLGVPNRASWEAFRSDPRRIEHTWLLDRANVAVQRHEVWTVD
jgi:hypothetical protein